MPAWARMRGHTMVGGPATTEGVAVRLTGAPRERAGDDDGPGTARVPGPSSRGRAGQLKEPPQAQELPAFGLSIVKPCFSIVSAKSMVAPSRYGTLIRSTTTSTPSKSRERVAVEHALVEVELVDQAGAAAGLHGDAQTQVVAALLLEQAADLLRGDVGEDRRRASRSRWSRSWCSSR